MKLSLRKIVTLPIRLAYVLKWKFLLNHFGWKSILNKPLRIDGGGGIFVGNNVVVEYKTWLAAMSLTGYDASLIIEDGCRIGNFNHIYSTRSIILHKNVLTADKVYISDNLHGYEDVHMAITNQPVKQIATVEIGEGAWIGENVCIIGASIGKHCVIGANSVVTHDIPDFSVAVGVPARVIKRYDHKHKKWMKTN